MHDFNEIIGSLGTRASDSGSGREQMLAHMILDHLCKETLYGAPASGKQAHDLGALDLRFQRPLHGVNLPAQFSYPVDEFRLFPNGVSHYDAPYTLPG
jgi:hypothetical protein